MKTMYTPTIDGKPAGWNGYFYHAWGLNKPEVLPSLEAVRELQQLDRLYRINNGLPEGNYGYVLVSVPTPTESE